MGLCCSWSGGVSHDGRLRDGGRWEWVEGLVTVVGFRLCKVHVPYLGVRDGGNRVLWYACAREDMIVTGIFRKS